jgi:fructoselysine-6-P-deglycase FrlB-like protein
MKGDGMSAIEDDITSTPAIARQTITRVGERGEVVAEALQGPAVFLGSGSSYRIGVAAASLYEAERGQPAQSLLGSEYLPRSGWTHVAISRTGKTTELVEGARCRGTLYLDRR